MTSKEQANHADKETAKRQPSRPEAQNVQTPVQQFPPAAIIRRARLDPRSLTPRDFCIFSA